MSCRGTRLGTIAAILAATALASPAAPQSAAPPAPTTTAPAAAGTGTATAPKTTAATTDSAAKKAGTGTATATAPKTAATTTEAAATKPTAAAATAKKKTGSTARASKPALTTTTTATPEAKAATTSKPEGAQSLKGGQEGTVFRSLTVEGEDRVHIDFERPELEITLDPSKAPGLEWGSARDVLDRVTRDPATPLLGISASQPMPYLGRPWLDCFVSGAVAHFRPQVDNVDRWKLVVADSRGRAVATYTGRGAPPRDITWDGRAQDGTPVTPGLTYSYAFEAFDKAGNKRNIVGPGFVVPAYRIATPAGPVLTFTGDSLGNAIFATRTEGVRSPDLLIEAASWINQVERTDMPFRVTATARSADQADGLATAVARSLGTNVIGGAARLKTATVVQPDAPAAGTVTIAPANTK